jgi:glutaredoxin
VAQNAKTLAANNKTKPVQSLLNSVSERDPGEQIMPKRYTHKLEEKRKVEVFSAGCAVCNQTIELIKILAGRWDEITIHDTKETQVAKRAKGLGIRTIPAVVIDGTLTGCCAGRGCDESILRAHGLGQPLSKRLPHKF